jgi:hypothetical protein
VIAGVARGVPHADRVAEVSRDLAQMLLVIERAGCEVLELRVRAQVQERAALRCGVIERVEERGLIAGGLVLAPVLDGAQLLRAQLVDVDHVWPRWRRRASFSAWKRTEPRWYSSSAR